MRFYAHKNPLDFYCVRKI